MGEQSVWGVGRAYEPYVGRWSRLVAREFVDWLALPPGARWLDVGCGTGALTETLLGRANPAEVRGIDPSAGFLALAREQVCDPRVRFDVGDACSLAVEPGSCDAVVSALVLNFVPDVAAAMEQMTRAVRPGGVVAAYVWDYAGKMELMRHFWDAAVALAPADIERDEGRRFPLCQPGPLRELFERAGLTQVEVRSIDVPTRFRDFDDYWNPFLGGQFPAPDYAMSLGETARAALRERIRSQLPIAADGSIALIARAWAVRGTR
ncbi:MAG TPA: methyltransferase domain-containing protein [Burkholderiales bacterium]|nr:methyltransferase domain-containing protein [Burkholderiales bacterium]